MVLRLDDPGPPRGGNLCPEAGAADAAAHDQNVQVNHSPIVPSERRLRIGKPHRLEAFLMFNGAFTEILLFALATLLVVAAVIDVRTFTISNRLNLTVALLAPLYWLSVSLSPWPGIAIQIAAA